MRYLSLFWFAVASGFADVYLAAYFPGFSATDCPVSRGPVGVLLAVLLMTVIQVVLKQIPKLRPVYKVIAR